MSIRRCPLSRGWLWRWGHSTRRHLTQHLKEETDKAMCTSRGKEFAAKCPDHSGEWLVAGAGQTGELTQALPTHCKGSHNSEQRHDMSRLVF